MASEAKWTPGPWRVHTSERRRVLCVVSDDTWICGELSNGTVERLSETKANAMLIAAAPDLAEAARMAIESRTEPFSETGELKGPYAMVSVAAYDAIVAAYAKARGE